MKFFITIGNSVVFALLLSLSSLHSHSLGVHIGLICAIPLYIQYIYIYSFWHYLYQKLTDAKSPKETILKMKG